MNDEDKRVMNDIIQEIKEINRQPELSLRDLLTVEELSKKLITFIEPFINNDVKDTQGNS